MRLANAFLVITVLLASAMPAVPEARPHCEERWGYTRTSGMNGDVNMDDAYNFGRVIQKHVDNRDLAGLFSLVDGELENGPRQRFVAGRTFGDIFTEDWRSAVVGSEPDCHPVGLRGFMLGGGKIWFTFDRFDSGQWAIFSINGATEEHYPLTGAGLAWRSAGKIIGPECFEPAGYGFRRA